MSRDLVRRRLANLLLVGLVVVVAGTLLLAGRVPADRAEQLGTQLRCPVCQSESVADSRSDTALAMQARIVELVDEGSTDQQVIDYFVARYGDWIVLSPPLGVRSAALWLLPPAAVALVLVALYRWRRSTRTRGQVALSETDRQRLADAIDRVRDRDETPDE